MREMINRLTEPARQGFMMTTWGTDDDSDDLITGIELITFGEDEDEHDEEDEVIDVDGELEIFNSLSELVSLGISIVIVVPLKINWRIVIIFYSLLQFGFFSFSFST